jgi:hypothetical protein
MWARQLPLIGVHAPQPWRGLDKAAKQSRSFLLTAAKRDHQRMTPHASGVRVHALLPWSRGASLTLATKERQVWERTATARRPIKRLIKMTAGGVAAELCRKGASSSKGIHRGTERTAVGREGGPTRIPPVALRVAWHPRGAG